MSYYLDFSAQAQKDINYHRTTGNKALLRKILLLLEEITEHPFEGTGKPELLKYELSGCWFRRINQEHRLVYQIVDDTVRILSAKGHYK